ncbi:aspartate aminotransferase family protein [Plantactinospora sp. CA-294935]|uniref:aminotransferase family protein n=1 Tax=Plantactinospora sp. CA-294935 TaxID=3240012 RepID=UPI003D93666E
MSVEIEAPPGRIGLWHGITPLAVSAELLDEDAQQVSGAGVWVTDRAGRTFLDARAGMWNVALGYRHPTVIDAVTAQLRTLPAGVTIRFEQPPQITMDYAERLLDRVGGDYATVKLYQSGAQAVEGAVLLSRYLSRIEGTPGRDRIIALKSSWHGAGVAAGAVTGEPHVHGACGPLMAGVSHVDPPGPDDTGTGCAAVAAEFDRLGPDRVAAVIVEPVLGTDVRPLPDGYLAGLAALCRRRGALLVVDEITTGFGRTGALSRSLADGVHADLLLLGKGITGGYLPMSAMLVGSALAARLLGSPTREGFPHGSTSDGYPLGAAAGMAVLDVFDAGLLDHVAVVGAYLRDRLETLRERHASIVDIRGRGLMLGIELATGGVPWPAARCESLRFACEEHGLLIHTGNNVVDLMPPLIVTAAECDEICARFSRALSGAEAGW